ncbi:hypothetical protein CFP65_3459 [Kitasatospora sp. MMS16-BH015]|uniref:GNAT family N-acetyltransferase n=1 Tax=Kitasatospora sp. MMS16-BH015 TaxID=2018025 RepID=UPI000CA39194|nr:GNAT family protein [Kitasatospora sp. MMS16-BH015]AUG78253.1 hypothetical protein CFP65_3459 [Kitasatospora sp. MMS16-BH015]
MLEGDSVRLRALRAEDAEHHLRRRTDNERAVRAFTRLGFREEGRRRQAVQPAGRYHDRVLFGLLREECTAPPVARTRPDLA